MKGKQLNKVGHFYYACALIQKQNGNGEKIRYRHDGNIPPFVNTVLFNLYSYCFYLSVF